MDDPNINALDKNLPGPQSVQSNQVVDYDNVSPLMENLPLHSPYIHGTDPQLEFPMPTMQMPTVQMPPYMPGSNTAQYPQQPMYNALVDPQFGVQTQGSVANMMHTRFPSQMSIHAEAECMPSPQLIMYSAEYNRPEMHVLPTVPYTSDSQLSQIPIPGHLPGSIAALYPQQPMYNPPVGPVIGVQTQGSATDMMHTRFPSQMSIHAEIKCMPSPQPIVYSAEYNRPEIPTLPTVSYTPGYLQEEMNEPSSSLLPYLTEVHDVSTGLELRIQTDSTSPILNDTIVYPISTSSAWCATDMVQCRNPPTWTNEPVTLDAHLSSEFGSMYSLQQKSTSVGNLGSAPIISLLDDEDDVLVSQFDGSSLIVHSNQSNGVSAKDPERTSSSAKHISPLIATPGNHSHDSANFGHWNNISAMPIPIQRFNPHQTLVAGNQNVLPSSSNHNSAAPGYLHMPKNVSISSSHSSSKLSGTHQDVFTSEKNPRVRAESVLVGSVHNQDNTRSHDNFHSNQHLGAQHLKAQRTEDAKSNSKLTQHIISSQSNVIPEQGGLNVTEPTPEPMRVRSRSVVNSRVSAYNMKFRSDLSPSTRPRSLTNAASNTSRYVSQAPSGLPVDGKRATEIALKNNIERHKFVQSNSFYKALQPAESPHEQENTDHAENHTGLPHTEKPTGKQEQINTTDTIQKSAALVKKPSELHYKSAQSLRSIKSRRASLKFTSDESLTIQKHSHGTNERSVHSIHEVTEKSHGGADKKRSKRIQIQKSIVKLSWFDRQLIQSRRKLKYVTAARRDGLGSLFSGTLKLIEGRFGTGVGSYFRISKTIFVMNLVLGTLWVSVVLIQAMLSLGGSYFDNNVPVNRSWASIIYSKSSAKWFDNVQNFFNGDGWLEYTPGFYSALPPSVLNGTYRMDLAYVFSILASIIISFVLILRRMRSEYVRTASIKGQDDVYPFAVITFSTWGHTIQRQDMLQNQIFAISTLIKIAISQNEVKARKTAALLSKSTYKLLLIRLTTNMICISILVIAGLFIYDSVTLCTGAVNTFFYNVLDVFSQNLSPNNVRCTSPTQPTPFPPYVVSISNAILPSVFYLISQYEQYSDPQWETRATLARSYMIKICSVYLMLFSMYPQVSDAKVTCWEHEVAKRFYSLLWLDLGLTCISTIFSAILTKKIYGEYEFDITSNILELVYRQAIIWIGSIYAPIMSFISVLSTTIIFYIKRYTAQPPRRIFNTYTQVIWFLMFMLLTLVLVAAPVLFAVVILRPSSSCGPYRQTPANNIRFELHQGAFSVISKSIDQITEPVAKQALVMIGSIAVIGPILAALLIWVYYLLAVSHKRSMRVIELENEVKEERNDKKALIRFYGVKT